MISLLIRFILLVIVAAAFAWLADQPGDIKLRWLGYDIETSVMAAAITVFGIGLVLWMCWSLTMWMLDRPGAFGSWFKSRREKKGRDALSSGLIAVAAGDKDAAQGHAKTATAILGNDPMVKLLDAQAAQLRGDSARVKQLFEEMAEQPETRLLGLRGLHTEARNQSDLTRARALAEEAARINPKVPWASQAVLSYQSSSRDWVAIGQTINNQKSAKLIDRAQANAKNAVVLTAQAIELENDNPVRAGELALQAHKLDPSLVPAALIAARAANTAGSMRKATRILEKTWKLSPHPDLAEAYSLIRTGDSALDRLKRVTALVGKTSGLEGAVALAISAINANEWKTARNALSPYAHDRPQARICGLMAEIEEGEFGDKGRAREWLARAVRAPRDPAWTADGHISSTWLPASLTTGELGAFKWKVPVEGIAYDDTETTDALIPDEPTPGDDAVAINVLPDASLDPEDGETDNEDDEVEELDQSDDAEETATVDSNHEVPDETSRSNGNAEDTTQTIARQPDDPGPEPEENSKAKKGW